LIELRLEHLGGHAIEHLDPGKRRRLALAYALLDDPACLVVDEPTAGLGPQATRRMHEALTDLGDERTLLVATGQPRDVEAVCDHVVGLDHGQVVVDAPLDELRAETGIAVHVDLAGELETPALDRLRDHDAVAALRRDPDDEPDLEIWITEPEQARSVLSALVDAGAPVAAFAPSPPDLTAVLDEYMEGQL
jgi:ABC-type multidrug transport system ATPase subunit